MPLNIRTTPHIPGALLRGIFLTQGKIAYVDDDDYKKLNLVKWHVNLRKFKTRILYYAVHNYWPTGRYGVCKTHYMHRLIMNPEEGLEIDHIDGNGLNNSKMNLRVVTHKENKQNKFGSFSIYPGVQYNSWTNRWIAVYNKKNLGECLDEKVAYELILAAKYLDI